MTPVGETGSGLSQRRRAGEELPVRIARTAWILAIAVTADRELVCKNRILRSCAPIVRAADGANMWDAARLLSTHLVAGFDHRAGRLVTRQLARRPVLFGCSLGVVRRAPRQEEPR
jgi:hypothetical protein